ncbi:MAG: acyl-CoA dehydratase activase, partial [Thermodesulfobacteriota bacterium]|nr:acyl-CoA dehydratase activase [Thermodesulfobacteriota bacterium]
MMYTAGLDGGSVSVKLVLVDDAGEILLARYERHKGRPLVTALELLEQAARKYPDMLLALTGSTGKAVAKALDAPHISELSAFALSTTRLHPQISTIIEMGGEDSKLILLEDGTISDFSMNSVCAAGTGSFLDQQAERMRLSIEEFSRQATLSEHPPRIAGRCSVFAKSDMIHLQQIATPLEDIVAGLCFAVARNFKGSIVRGRKIRPKVAFMGGVAENRGMVRAFREVFELDDLTVPDPPTMMGALGAAFTAKAGKNASLNLEGLRQAINVLAYDEETGTRLMAPGDGFAERHMNRNPDSFFSPTQRSAPVDIYMGIDV